jgi:hypothetical protein
VQQAAIEDAGRNGFVSGGDVTVAVNNPPVSGDYSGNPAAVEAIIDKREELLFLSLIATGGLTIEARAVAAVQTTGTACVLALDQSASDAVTNNGNAAVDMAGCTVAANSNSASAISFSGSSSLTAYSLWTVGDYNRSGSAVYNLTNPAMTHAWQISDPYAGLTIPALSGCDHNNTSIGSGNVTLEPGIYCGGISIGSQANVTFEPGTYYLDRGDFTVNAGAVVRCNCSAPGSGTTFVLTSTGTTNQIGTVRINGGADVVLQAPTDSGYPYPGVLFFQDRNAPATDTARLNGGSTMTLTGTVYFPAQVTQWNGNNSSPGSNCVQIVALQVVFTGNSRIVNTGCQAYGIDPITITGVRLVE